MLELGGKSANIVFPDVDIAAAASLGVATSIVGLTGQGCAMPTRLLVHEAIYEDMIERVTQHAAAIKLGDPFDPSVDSGPVVNEAAQTRILGMIDRARADRSGTLLVGGSKPGGDLARGFYVEPTVFGDVDPTSEIAQVEVFGPVFSVIRFSSDEEAIDIANSTNYGLASYIWSNDMTACPDGRGPRCRGLLCERRLSAGFGPPLRRDGHIRVRQGGRQGGDL